MDLTNTKTSYVDQLASLSQEFEKSEFRNNKQSKVEEVLKKQVAELQSKLDSAHQGREAESEMAQEALTKASQMERSVLELNAKLKSLMDENADLKEQLYSALEHHTTKSCESENSKVSFKIANSSGLKILNKVQYLKIQLEGFFKFEIHWTIFPLLAYSANFIF